MKSEFFESLNELKPSKLVFSSKADAPAILCWGKAALGFYRARRKSAEFSLVIVPSLSQRGPKPMSTENAIFVLGEHPFPGSGSFKAGKAIIAFFKLLSTHQVRRLDVYLSGGASSLAWILRTPETKLGLRRKLKNLYRKRLTIAELNEKRSKLCGLKKGAAYLLLRKFSPLTTRVRVFVVSDVRPYGARVVGSGPFARVGVRHIVLADNGTLVRCLDEKLRRKHPLAHISILPFSNEPLDVVARNLVRNINRRIEIARRSGREQFLILGCEPTLRLPPGFKNGGRQTHLAALLLSRFLPRIAAGELKILCAASDGIDGGSKSMGAFLNARVASHFQKSASLQTLEKSLRDFNSATALKKADALLLPRDTSTNVQDVVVVQIRPIARTDRRRV